MKVLLIRLSSLGDVVLATAAVEALAQDQTDAEVHVLTKPAFRDVLGHNPAVTRVVEWKPDQGLPALARALRAERYDWVVDLHGNLRTRALRLLTPGLRWSRYEKGSVRRRFAVLTHSTASLPRTHVVDRYVAALRPLGVGAARRLPRLYPGVSERERVAGLLRRAGWDGASTLVALAPGARWATKAWPEENWRVLLGLLRERGQGFPMLVGGPGEEELCQRLLGDSGAAGASLAGSCSILETAAALKLARALVTNDSATLHMATAVGTRVVALFGPTVTGFGFYPLGSEDAVLQGVCPRRPCSLHGTERCPEGSLRCLADISERDVLAALEDLHPPAGVAPGAAPL